MVPKVSKLQWVAPIAVRCVGVLRREWGEFGEHGAVREADEGEVFARIVEAEIRVQFRCRVGAVFLRGEDDAIAGGVDGGATRKEPLVRRGLGRAIAKRVALKIDGEGIRIVDFDPVRMSAINVRNAVLVIGDEFVDAGWQRGNADMNGDLLGDGPDFVCRREGVGGGG